MSSFPGFSDSDHDARLSMPESLFTQALPGADDLPALKLLLYFLWLRERSAQPFAYQRLEQITQSGIFPSGFDASPALADAVSRGYLLAAPDPDQSGQGTVYFLNDSRGRAAVQAIELGAWKSVQDESALPVLAAATRPNAFALYEQNIGPLSPHIAAKIDDALEEYTATQVEDAILAAAERNVRNWAYINGILRNQSAPSSARSARKEQTDERHTGRDAEEIRRKYTGGKYKDFVNRD